MLMVYMATLPAARPSRVESLPAAVRVTREVDFEALEGWCVSLYRCADAAQARIQAAGAVADGLAGCVAELNGETHLLGAMCASERDARRAAEPLRQSGYDAEVVCLSADRLRLRVTAPESQIDAIAAADAMLTAQAAQLGEIARQLEGGEMRVEAARTLCALASSEAGALRDQLSAGYGASENALCAGLIAQLDALAERMSTLATGASGTAALAGMSRCAQLETFLAHWTLRRDMLAA